MIKALVFDFDGLILDTEVPVFQSWSELYLEHGCELSFEVWGNIIGTMDGEFDPLDELERQLGRALDREQVGSQRLEREMALINEQSVLPGVVDYLEAAKGLGLKVGLASSSSCDWVTGHLERLGLLSYFDEVRASDDVTRTKPDPSLYQAIVEGLGVPAGQVLALEDSPHGVTAARRAGLFVVAVPNELTRRLSLDHADLRLDSLADMPLEALLTIVEDRLREDGGKP